MSDQQVLTEFADGIATITLNRPAALNALTAQMMEGLIDATGRIERDADTRCVLIRGAGDQFMAGGDVKSFHKSLTEERDNYLRRREMQVVGAHQLIYQLRRMPKPVLVSVKGAAAGFGLSLVLAADLAIAADDAIFTLAYRHIGLSADGGATYFLPRVVGERRALELTLLGERFDAQRALSLGIVNWVVPVASLETETTKLAKRLAAGPTAVYGRSKRLIQQSLDQSLESQLQAEAESFAQSAIGADFKEGVRAFVAKRPPRFSGR